MQDFHSVVVRDVWDIKECLESICATYALKGAVYEILRIRTFKQFSNQQERIALSVEEFANLMQDEGAYNAAGFEVSQSFDISVREARESDLVHFVALEVDVYRHTLTLVLRQGLEIASEQFWEELYQEIECQKALCGVIIKPLDEALKPSAIAELKTQCGDLSGVLDDDVRVEILRTSVYKPQIHSSAVLLPKVAWERKNAMSLEAASYAVDAQEEVLCVSVPQDGVSGRDLAGRYVEIETQSESSLDSKKPLAIIYDDKLFSKLEREGSIVYTALSKGFVSFSDNTLKLLELQEFKEITMRSTGSLVGGIEKDIMVTITCPNPQNDALGQGTMLEAAQIDIVGSVGEKAQIIGVDVKIHGQTHQSSSVRAKRCEIDFLKGSVRAEDIKIKHSEMGHIDGREVEIDEVSGGSVRAKNLKIHKLHSHAKVYVSDTLELQTLVGSENEIYLTTGYYALREAIECSNAQIEHCIQKINALLHLLNKNNALIKQSKPIIAPLKAIIEEKKRLQEPIDSKITKAVAEYVLTLKRARFLKERILSLQASAKASNNALQEIDEGLKKAKILIHSPWNNHNEVFYEYLFPKKGRDMLTLQDAKQSHIIIDKKNHKLLLVDTLPKSKEQDSPSPTTQDSQGA
ncbi:hypothetical protein [uncultured Helicobacter sp.]|uniref:hypothetical protein n=1 Tax=uncultured Helicobacter sp. TaxID=175537 RepID=UPI0037533F6A